MAYGELAAEAQRIVNSPYPTTLQQLRDIVCKHTSQTDIDKWTLSNPCLIQPLVAALLEGLAHWGYVLDIITAFSSNKALRDVMLAQKPGLLEWLVSEAIKSSGLISKYALPAIGMLSHPLPGGVACPAGVQTLFIQLFDHGAKNPSASTVRPIYQILKGQRAHFVDLLSSKTMAQFEDHVFNILQAHVKAPHQDTLSIYCLAVMKLLTVTPDLALLSSSQRYNTQDFFASTNYSTPRWRSDKMVQFFLGNKGQRTTQLAILQALSACRAPTPEISVNDSCESLIIANEVIDAIPPETKKAWTAANGAVTGRLLEKLLANDMDPRVQLHGLAFAASVLGVHNLPLRAKNALSQKVLHVQSLEHCEKQCDRLPLLDCCIEVTDQKSVTRFTSEILDFACESNLADSVATTDHLVTVLDQLSMRTGHLPLLTEGVTALLARADFSGRLAALKEVLGSPTAEPQAGSKHACAVSLRTIRSRIVRSFSNLLLNAAYASEQSRPLAKTVQQLLSLYALSCQSQLVCGHQKRTPKIQTSFATEVTAPSGAINGHWKQALDAHLQQRAQDEHGSISKIFAKACADLEKRCESIEQPVREERERYEGLQQQYDDLSRAYSELEAKAIEEGMRYDTLQREKETCETDLEAKDEEVDDLTHRVEGLQNRLRSQAEDAEQRMCNLRREREADALQHATAVASNEGEFEEVAERLTRLREDVSNSHQALQRACDDLKDSKIESDALRAEIQSLRKAHSQQQDEISALDEVERALNEQQKRMAGQVEKLQSELAAAKDGGRKEITRLQQEAADVAEAARLSHEEKVARLAEERENDINNFKEHIVRMKSEAQESQQRYKSESAQRNAKLQEYYKKIEKLQQKCVRKDEQIAEATAMRTNLMVAMGIAVMPNTNNDASSANPGHRSRRPSICQPNTTENSEIEISPPTPGDTDETEVPDEHAIGNVSFNSQASSAEGRNGPTPKRPRPARKSLRTSTMLQTQGRLSASAARASRSSLLPGGRSVGKNARQPLLGLSVNQSPSKSGYAGSPTKKGSAVDKAPKGTFDDDDDDSLFAGSEVFGASTPRRGKGGQQ